MKLQKRELIFVLRANRIYANVKDTTRDGTTWRVSSTDNFGNLRGSSGNVLP